jgi:predicted CXXCH cytochrome family protein
MFRSAVAFALLPAAAASAAAGEQACVDCHAPIRVQWEKRADHAKGDGSCSGCHTDHLLPRPQLDGKHFLKTLSADLCIGCHEAVARSEFQHEPARRDCTICHVIHAESHALLRAQSNQLCLECHSTASKERLEADGPLRLFRQQVTLPPHYFSNLPLIDIRNDRGHPVSNHPVLRAAANGAPAITCLTCHRPHGADKSRWFLVDQKEDRFELCERCHQ